jgi:uncharacterized membrane protein YhhN
MMNIFIIAIAILSLIPVLLAERGGYRVGLLISKTALSALFVLTAWLQPHAIPRYTLLLIMGLIFCMGGDICLAFPQRRMFLLGLISFLVGHIFYGVAFFGVAPLNSWTGFGSFGVLVMGAGVYLWLAPHLGDMKRPVQVYVLVISAMVVGAVTVAADHRFTWVGRVMVLGGAICFYFSDIFVARDRFVKEEFTNRVIGLPMYYGGQFLLAFSVGFLKMAGSG